jgi:hypothetical protein
VREPGVKLAPAGITLRELVDEYCGGMLPGHTLKAYLPGGASGGILPARLADVPLDFDTLQPHGCFIGSAAVIVLSQHDSRGRRGAQPDALLRARAAASARPAATAPPRPRGADGCASDRWDLPLLADLSPGDARRVDLRPGPGGAQPGGQRDALLSATSWHRDLRPRTASLHARRPRRAGRMPARRLLEVAQREGIAIPHLCHNPA